MSKKQYKTRNRHGLQVVTLCISTALVLILLGIVVSSVLTAHNLSNYVKQNLTVTLMFENDMTNSEAQQLCARLKKRVYVNNITFISKEQALKEQTKVMGTDPSEFIGTNPFLSSVEVNLNAEYANADSLRWISQELKKYPKVSEINYPQDLVNSVNNTLNQINIVLLVLAVLLTIISFELINNSVRLGIYARRFIIHTMKLVGASWGFIRRPFIVSAVVTGLIAALIANGVLACCFYAIQSYQALTWFDFAIVGISVLVFGIAITTLCTFASVNKYLRMKAGELYKI